MKRIGRSKLVQTNLTEPAVKLFKFVSSHEKSTFGLGLKPRVK